MSTDTIITTTNHKEKLKDLVRGDEVVVVNIVSGELKHMYGVYPLTSAGSKRLQIVFDDGIKKNFSRETGKAENKSDEAIGMRVMPRGCRFAVNLLD